jgi:hypothetical protein
VRCFALVLVVLVACGRLQFDDLTIDGATDTTATRFCTAATARIPADAQISMCMDFDDVAVGVLADGTQLVAGSRVMARGRAAFTTIEITNDAIATTHAFRYRPAPSSVCDGPDPGCCYADLFIGFGDFVFTSHAHLEYDHYLETTPLTFIGAYFWGSLYFPYTQDFVSPALTTGHWYHVTIDGDVGASASLVITVDGVERPNVAGANDLSAGIEGAVGTFCDDVTASGYIDNVMFWGR